MTRDSNRTRAGHKSDLESSSTVETNRLFRFQPEHAPKEDDNKFRLLLAPEKVDISKLKTLHCSCSVETASTSFDFH